MFFFENFSRKIFLIFFSNNDQNFFLKIFFSKNFGQKNFDFFLKNNRNFFISKSYFIGKFLYLFFLKN